VTKNLPTFELFHTSFLFFFLCAIPCPAEGKSKPSSHALVGSASWYGRGFKKTASGERYDPNSMTAAHRTLPFGTMVRVTSVSNQRTVTVRINNRGPYKRGRVIDLSHAAARELQMIKAGVVRVRLEVLGADKTTKERER
jgi:rare lipoprotein A